MKVLSLDIATRNTGYAVFQNGKVLDFGTIKHDDKDFLVRGNYMSEFVRLLVEKYGKFDTVVLEELKVISNQKVLVMLGIVQGLILREVRNSNIVFIEPTVWRKPFGLNGKRELAKKKAIEKAKYLGYFVENDDEAEAILIGKSFLKI